MNTRSTAWIRGIGAITVLSAVLLSHGAAQAASGGAAGSTRSNATAPTNLPNVLAYTAPPAGFDPAGASTADLQRYGFPSRPDARTDPKRYATWLTVIHHMKHRVTPVLKPLPSFAANGTSNNWAGSIISTPPRCYLYACFPSPYYIQEVAGMWTVPDVSGSTQDSRSSTWVGLDGVKGSPTGSNQVEQAGTEQAYTNGSPQYYAWVELYPDPELQISNLSVSPGDSMYVDVYCNGSGVRFIVDNLTTGIYGTTILPAKYGCPGDTGEWITERPGLNGTVQPLANFSYVYMHDLYARVGNAWTGGNTVVGGTRNSFNTYQVDMINNGDTLAQTVAWSWMSNGMTIFWKGYQ